MTADILRQKFLEFFKSKKHAILESDSLVPENDPTVLFTPAGMNQFKKEFLGDITNFTRAATAQRCLRTDDLDKVGKTSGHHTFFEMLGNFSFGDYFKKEAIAWAWEFLTDELKVSKDRLWVSVYRDDAEAYRIWNEQIKIPTDRIIKLGDKENFWPSEAKEKGPNGPCGPCSEIFFDFGREAGCGKPDCSPVCGCGRFVEVWNLVFTQFNRRDKGVLEPLPKKNIDTGMGLERLTAVVQGVRNNFETDLFQPLVKEIIAEAKGDPAQHTAFVYAVADHLRAASFAMYDGVLPSNEARGYVIRKLIRKSSLHLRSLGITHAFLYKLVPVLAETMKVSYPGFSERRENIAQIILEEEKNFISTLHSSDALFKEKFSSFSKHPDPQRAGVVAFQLYDTHGIPFELTKSWLDARGIGISEEAFKKELEHQKSRSKSQSKMKGDVFAVETLSLGIKDTKFLGYEKLQAPAGILKILREDKPVKKIGKGEEAVIILKSTVFYGESGGQAGDTGELIKGKSVFLVSDTRKSGNIILHTGRVKEGSFKNSDRVVAKVDAERRLAIARNHTATHLLQAALRKVLGAHIQQQGSFVGPERLRFDFAHFKDLNTEELDRVEEVVNAYIINNYSLSVKQMPLSSAKKSGALAFFAEKYAGTVRVVSVGDFSKELCGGTHLDHTGQIGLFKITQEGSVAAQVRRIEAVTGTYAYRLIKEEEGIVSEITSVLNTTKERIIPEIQKRISRLKELEKQAQAQKICDAKTSIDALMNGAALVREIKIIGRVIDGADMNVLRTTVDLVKQKTDKAVIALGSVHAGRALLVMGITQDLCERGLDASKLIPQIAKHIGGSGGGRKDFAQAGGNLPENFAQVFEELKGILQKNRTLKQGRP